MTLMQKWIVELEGERLLTFAKTRAQPFYTTKEVRFAIEHNGCRVNGKVERFGSYRLKKGDEVTLTFAKRPQFAKERILFEDDHLLAYDKPPSIASEDLAALAKAHLVHRLDRDTSGVILFAKTESTKKAIEELFRSRKISKTYLAVVEGMPKEPSGTIDAPLAKIGGREGAVIWGVKPSGLHAETHWEVLENNQGRSLLRLTPKTGRTHQLRVHLRFIGLPILGDCEYGNRHTMASRPMLHALSLHFSHPVTHVQLKFDAPLPTDFEQNLPSRV